MIPAPPVPILAEPWSARVPRDAEDLALIHRWMSEPQVQKYWQQNWPLEQWREELAAQLAGEHSVPCLITHYGEPLAYVEVYRVARDRLAGYYEYEPHDLGVHIAIGEPDRRGGGLGRALLRALTAALLDADPRCARIVAEPDSGNAASIAAFTAAGFRPARQITLPEKLATLMHLRRSE